ncbi:MAG: nitrate/nitrite transporter NrtS [Actinomycetota bacterium]|nr:nitrate/nitrite transporter NrtS [Actinomycetota bacterium]
MGTILFLINHLGTVLACAATAQTWIKIVVTYLVPFTVANIGLLLGSR